MNWFERMNKSIDYIEGNLTGYVDKKFLAGITLCSEFHYHRIFSMTTGMTLGEYIRNRRMSQAADDLIRTNERVIDVALKYGYESPEAFTRAFRQFHGITPTQTRKPGAYLRTFPRISFMITLKGEKSLDYRIEEREAFTVYGVERLFPIDDETNSREIPVFWNEVWESGRADALFASGYAEWDTGALPLNAMCDGREVEAGKFSYLIHVLKGKNSDTEGFTEINVPASKWAILKSPEYVADEKESVEIIQEHFKRVYSDWLPNTGFTMISGYDMELYYDTPDGTKSYMEVWLRVE
ncbi:MAG TPA: helix-turn-helix domain-containing protein [Clostridia bacterium]|nr:helix-turn-helix domain-containing protein [Clostridia bacterium]HPQ46523.1 helix-turn-helix domain-containing protein [Clostridia bacterium]HRX42116.1 helix-turn-helix domain-containing protein [Clostridia bacterium]